MNLRHRHDANQMRKVNRAWQARTTRSPVQATPRAFLHPIAWPTQARQSEPARGTLQAKRCPVRVSKPPPPQWLAQTTLSQDAIASTRDQLTLLFTDVHLSSDRCICVWSKPHTTPKDKVSSALHHSSPRALRTQPTAQSDVHSAQHNESPCGHRRNAAPAVRCLCSERDTPATADGTSCVQRPCCLAQPPL